MNKGSHCWGGLGWDLYPREACGASAEHAVLLHNGAFSSRGRPPAGVARAGARGRGAFNVAVETLYDVARPCFFQVRGFGAVDLIFEALLFLGANIISIQSFTERR